MGEAKDDLGRMNDTAVNRKIDFEHLISTSKIRSRTTKHWVLKRSKNFVKELEKVYK